MGWIGPGRDTQHCRQAHGHGARSVQHGRRRVFSAVPVAQGRKPPLTVPFTMSLAAVKMRGSLGAITGGSSWSPQRGGPPALCLFCFSRLLLLPQPLLFLLLRSAKHAQHAGW